MFSRTFWGSGRPGSNRRPSAWERLPERYRNVLLSTHTSHRDRRFGRPVAPRMSRLFRRIPLLGCGILATVALAGGLGSVARADAKPWPKNPTVKQVRSKVGEFNWQKARRVAVCETGGRIDWYLDLKTGRPLGTYVSAMGMYVRTFAYGQAQTGLRGRNWQEQVAIAVAAHPITGGWSGWGCGGA